MNGIFMTFFSMSVSGSLLILILFLLKPLFQNRISRQWQYYVWLIVVARLLLPVTPDASLVGSLFQWAGQAAAQSAFVSMHGGGVPLTPPFSEAVSADKAMPSQNDNLWGDAVALQRDIVQDGAIAPKNNNQPENTGLIQGGNITGNAESLGGKAVEDGSLWMLWLTGALLLLMRKITSYQSFVKYIRAGSVEVSDIDLLELLAKEGVRAGIKRPVELYANTQVCTPMLLGFLHPCIVLPSDELPGNDFLCIVRHELTHYRRRDMFYKWLVQITICLHWFNPLVYLMGREINRACELSCDEAVIRSLDGQGRRAYGDTLLHAVGAGRGYEGPAVSVTLGESAELLKERLDAIMKFQKMSKTGYCVAFLLSIALALGFAASGAYAAESIVPDSGAVTTKAAARNEAALRTDVSIPPESILPVSEDIPGEIAEMETLVFKGETYYLVFNEEQLRAIGRGKYGMDLNYMQQADIRLSEGEWIPIGTGENPFTGSYNGNGYEIVGLTMNNPDAEIVGMFGVAENAHIYNITLRDYDFTDAGKNVTALAIAPIFALGLGDVRSYDNFAYPREATSIPQEQGLLKSTSIPQTQDLFDSTFSWTQDNNFLQFGAEFAVLDDNSRTAWLEKIYNDRDIALFAFGLQQLNVDSSLVSAFAHKAYEDGLISFFSVLTDHMSQETLESWLDKVIQEKQVGFLSVILRTLNRDGELDVLEEESERQRLAEYEDLGIIKEGKTYYYQGEIVHIFMDHPQNSSYYWLDMNPYGTVNIKVIRDEDGQIQGVDYITEAEITALFGDMDDPDDLE